MIKGLALLAFSFLLGQWMGELLGSWLGINANVGGVGFAMIILLLSKEWLIKQDLLNSEMEFGIHFWGKLYIPVVIAMAASLNVKSAISAGTLAILAGIVPVLISLMVFPFLIKNFDKSTHG
ncbi:malonate transporter subunit MadL [Algoriphagus zhangzhouensis]|uniref:Malonate transporter, MadL subunit n=1 Tax=Algoriphagus zhangzhouensis TaxID=1073327 RepID=A0A1M7Z680_9BACT|nr:malonate transporter subunit MadL [Algoriphagus zhangzhouensis]TDY49108.1 malonate transporter MadL subunit [Algoriphagus zhangzhouensis]SHO60443.1 malonate transporter, MadL subunit [Algoriphagus zhangzhouensis]